MDNMTNRMVAGVLRRIGQSLDILGESRFRILAYYRAAESIEQLGEDVAEIWRAGQLEELPGVGRAIAKKVEELLRTGHLHYYDQLQAQVPAGVVDMLDIPGVGPSTARILWREAGLQTVEDVQVAAQSGRLRSLPGLGPKSESRLLEGLKELARARVGDG
jgi:DNA polymerase (family 10)